MDSADLTQKYGSTLGELLAPPREMALTSGSPNTAIKPELDELTVAMAFGEDSIQDQAMAQACLSGLWLYHDFLDESHRLSQQIDTPTGSYWHAIMHRREPDFSNSKYWFAKVGEHPIFPELQRAAAEIAGQTDAEDAAFLAEQQQWDPNRFVDLVEQCVNGYSAAGELARSVQMSEWWLLFDFCFDRALGR